MNSQLAEYARLLGSWPGLVGPGADPLLLAEDALTLLPHLAGARSLVDVGSGGGMPGIPVKLARPDLAVTLVEADRSKAAFLVHAAATLGVEVAVVAERAEAAARRPELREAFDAAACRALASLAVAAELCLPFVRVGGLMLAMRSEAEPAWRGAALLGGGEPRTVPAASPIRERGVIVVIQKVAPTPAEYPRRPGVPGRRPLGI
jgi:16S rRNA (guanine527-N7)-methyltransferase